MTNLVTSTSIQWKGDEIARIDYRNLLASLNGNDPKGYEIQFRQPLDNPPVINGIDWYHGIIEPLKVEDPDLVKFFRETHGHVARILLIYYQKQIETIWDSAMIDGIELATRSRENATNGQILRCQLQLQDTAGKFGKVMEIGATELVY